MPPARLSSSNPKQRTSTYARRRPSGFSLIEMLATVAALVIVLGLAVSLARYVRRQSSEQLTKQLLAQLDVLSRRYHERYNAMPDVPSFVTGAPAGALGEKGTEGDERSGGPRGRDDDARSPDD